MGRDAARNAGGAGDGRPGDRCARSSPTTLRDQAVEKYHAIEGGEQTLRNLAAYVVVHPRCRATTNEADLRSAAASLRW